MDFIIKKNKTILLILFFTMFVNMVGFSMMIPIKPQLIIDITQTSIVEAAKWGGYLLFGYAFGQFLMSAFMTAIADKYGRKKVLIGSLMAGAIDFYVMGVTEHIQILLVARFLLGVFSATIATIHLCVLDISLPKQRAVNFGIILSGVGLGLTIGPFLGAVIGDAFGTRAPLFSGALLFLSNVVLVYFFVPETAPRLVCDKINWKIHAPFQVFKKLQNVGVPFPFLVASFMYQLATHVFTAIWTYYMIAKFDWGFLQIGISLVVVGLCNFLMQNVLIRILVPKFGEKRLFLIGVLCSCLSFYGYATVNTDWVIYYIIILGSPGALMKPCLQAIMSSYVSVQNQGKLMGAITSINGISLMIGPILMTQIFFYFSTTNKVHNFIGAPFVFSLILVLIGTFLIAKFLEIKKQLQTLKI